MTLAEFKAWFEGFIEDMDARPTEKQWKRIKARVKEIDGTAIVKEVIYRDYWRPYWAGPYCPSPGWTYLCNNSAGLAGDTLSFSGAASGNACDNTISGSAPSNETVMFAAGKADFHEMAA